MTSPKWRTWLKGPPRPQARTPPLLLSVAGAIAVLASALAPWSRSGVVSRNAFELASVADQLGAVDGRAARLALLTWFAVPLLVACAWMAATFIRPVLVVVFAGTVAVMGVLAGVVVVVSSLRIGPGPWLAVAAGVATMLMAARLATEQRRQ